MSIINPSSYFGDKSNMINVAINDYKTCAFISSDPYGEHLAFAPTDECLLHLTGKTIVGNNGKQYLIHDVKYEKTPDGEIVVIKAYL